MSHADIQHVIERQRLFFASGKTRPVPFRLAQLKKLKETLKKNESAMLLALSKDLGKSAFESYTAEIGFIYEEINLMLKKLQRWAKPKRVATPMLMQPGSSRIYTEPKGVVLIIASWNYPIQVSLAPLLAAISAGNCAVLKPSELAPATAGLLQRIIEQCFSPDYCAVVQGGVSETQELLTYRFDHIFFTGSTPVGKIVMLAAANHLTPVTLELGGKSPCIVDHGVDLEVTARRIVWGKFYNVGQTCIAPDYVLVPSALKVSLLSHMKKAIGDFYGSDPAKSPDYGRIIHTRHFDRLCALMQGMSVFAGGGADRETRYIAPTLLDKVTLDAPIMQEEIFGPLLPVLEYETLDQALQVVKQRPHPLACYVFTQDPKTEERVLQEISFGGGCINNTLLHLLNPNMPFGGIGPSGLGAYHGRFGFETFSHHKSIYKSPQWIDISLKYPPYKDRLALVKKVMR